MINKYLLRRFFANYIDGVISYLLLNIILYVFNVNLEHMSYQLWLLILLFSIYNIISDFIFSRSLGKTILKLKIIGFDNSNKFILFKQVIIRNLTRWIPLDQVSIFFNDNYLMWHDEISKTKIIAV